MMQESVSVLQTESLTVDNCIVVVLGSKSMEQRWVEVPALVRWY